MVRSYLIENRICFKGDGGSDTNGSSNSNNESNTTTADASFYDNERPGLTNQNRPVGGTTNVFQGSSQTNNNNDSDPDPIVDIVSMGLGQQVVPTGTGVSDEVAMNQFVDQLELEQRIAAAQQPQSVTANIVPTQAPVTSSPNNDGNSQAALALQLVNQAAQQSLASDNPSTPIDSVESAPGANDPMSGFFADAYDELYCTPDPNDAPATPPGTGLASILGGGILGQLGNRPTAADAQAFNIGQLQRMVEQTGPGTIDPNTGAVTGVQAGPGTLSMNALGGIGYSGPNDPNYQGPFANLVRGTAGMNMAGDDNVTSQPAAQPADPIDPGTTTPEQIDDLAINYLRNPFFLYSGTGNLYQPYGYAGGTLVDLLQTRGMTQPQQAAANLNLFGNPRDFV